MNIDIKGDILIVDEAHNITEAIEEANDVKLDLETFFKALLNFAKIKKEAKEKREQLEKEI